MTDLKTILNITSSNSSLLIDNNYKDTLQEVGKQQLTLLYTDYDLNINQICCVNNQYSMFIDDIQDLWIYGTVSYNDNDAIVQQVYEQPYKIARKVKSAVFVNNISQNIHNCVFLTTDNKLCCYNGRVITTIAENVELINCQ